MKKIACLANIFLNPILIFIPLLLKVNKSSTNAVIATYKMHIIAWRYKRNYHYSNFKNVSPCELQQYEDVLMQCYNCHTWYLDGPGVSLPFHHRFPLHIKCQKVSWTTFTLLFLKIYKRNCKFDMVEWTPKQGPWSSAQAYKYKARATTLIDFKTFIFSYISIIASILS